MTTVEIRNLVKHYGTEPAVRGVDLDIGDGELVVVVGPSGCGKTSLLRMVASLEPITAGEVWVDGMLVNDIPSNERDLAMMFQAPTLYPHMTVAENLGFPLKMAGMRRRDVRRRVRETADLLGVGTLLERMPSRLSGGQQQRVAMGRALIRRPALLLMDEPMSNLDAKLRTELRSAIGHLQHRLGITTMYVTHDQVEAMSLGHRIAVMRAGRIVQVAPPRHVYDRPVDAFVGQFVGTPPMNLFLATASSGELVIPAGRLRLPARYAPLDGPVIAGVRANHVQLTDPVHGIPVDVIAIERAADRVTLTASIAARPATVVAGGDLVVGAGPAPFTIEAPPTHDREVELWRPTYVRVDPDDVHLFDAQTGRAYDAADVMV